MVRRSPRRWPASRHVALGASPAWAMAPGDARGHDARMQVIRAAGPQRRGAASSVVARLLAGLILLAIAAVIVWYIVTTKALDGLDRVGNSVLEQQLLGTLAWGLAFLVPGAFAVLGLLSIVRAVEGRPRRRRHGPVASLEALSDEYTVAEDVRLPDGRLVPEIVVGPHGLTVVEELPPAAVSRPGTHGWELRGAGGRWLNIEDPLDRAARDGERVRRWLGTHMEDFVPRISVAVVADDRRVARTSEVAVLRPEELPGFLAAQPALRQMSPDRRRRIEALLRELLVA